MKSLLKRRILGIISTLAFSFLFLSCPNLKSYNNDVIILFTNDIRCSVLQEDIQVKDKQNNPRTITTLGYSAISGFKEQTKKNSNSNVVAVDSGNYVYGAGAGALLGQLSQGEEIIKIMEKSGYDIVGLGDKDFTYGVSKIRDYIRESNIEFTCSNIFRPDERSANILSKLNTTYLLKKFGMTTVAFIGVTSPDSENSGDLGSYEIKTNIDEVSDLVQGLANTAKNKGRADYIVLLSSLGASDNNSTDSDLNCKNLIKRTSKIDFVIDGSSQEAEPEVVNNLHNPNTLTNVNGDKVYYGHCGRYGEKIGVFKIDTTSSQPVFSVEYLDVNANVVPNETVKKYITNQQQDLSGRLQKRVGYAEVELTKYGPPADFPEETLNDPSFDQSIFNKYKSSLNCESFTGSYIADAFRSAAKARIGIVNAGGIGENKIRISNQIEDDTKRYISFEDVYKFLDHANSICVKKMKGDKIWSMIEQSVSMTNSNCNSRSYTYDGGASTISPNTINANWNGFLNVSGLKVYVDASRQTSKVWKIEVLKLNAPNANPFESSYWEELEGDREYTVAGTNYILINHGDGYSKEIIGDGSVEYVYKTDENTNKKTLLLEGEALAQYIFSRNSTGTVKRSDVYYDDGEGGNRIGRINFGVPQ